VVPLLLGIFRFQILVVLRSAYLILYERHLLGVRQLRQGPRKGSLFGLIQSVIDAFKLFKKEIISPKGSSCLYFYIMPLLAFIILLIQFRVVPSRYHTVSFNYSCLFFLALVGRHVYTLFFIGIASNSKYAYLGALRAGAQSISFEVTFFFVIFIVILCASGCRFLSGRGFMFPLVVFLFFCLLAELGRAPFDLSEGESELVSGYNIEFRGSLFIILFLTEYGSLLISRTLLGSLLLS